MRYLIDTDTASYFIAGRPRVVSKFLAHSQNWMISAITYHELVQGLMLARSEKIEEQITAFLQDVEVVEFASADALESGRLAALLKKVGTPIGYHDTMIAGHALSLKATLISNNTKHFSMVPELMLENWMK